MADLVDAAVALTQWPVTVKLSQPIALADETISELTFQRGRMGFLKGMPLDGVPSVEQLLTLAARMCGQSTAVLELVGEADVTAVLAVPLVFFARSLKGGGTP